MGGGIQTPSKGFEHLNLHPIRHILPFCHALCSLSVFSLAKGLQIILEISATYRLSANCYRLSGRPNLFYRLCTQCIFFHGNVLFFVKNNETGLSLG